MKNVRPIYCILVVFILGTLCGTLGTHLFYKCGMDSIISSNGENREERLVNRLDRKLDLNAGQKEQVRAIVHETQEDIRQVRRQFRPQMEAAIEKAQTKIGVLLTPEQRKKFEQIIAERKGKSHRKAF
jgi:Spy/CpxP family protein refolding chaperone